MFPDKTGGNKTDNVFFAILSVCALAMVVPFLWMILTAFKTTTEATSINPFVIFPGAWRTDSFFHVMQNMNFGRLYFNTIALIAGRVLCAVLTATMAGYALGRLEFPLKTFFFSLILVQMMVPSQIFIIPQYLMIAKLKMLNTMFALLFPGLITAFGTFLLRQNFMSLPADVEEAAYMDGANIGQTFLFIMFPLARSGIVALSIFTALFAFKELMWPLIVNTAADAMPLSAALAKLQGQFITNYPELMAASILACVPMIVIYLLFQRQFIQGVATSGGKL
ncbi:MAG: carbohydrate ABC transporter permease [Treponema sp.]|jgi:multiple sugar transport system permease protein|nr:carbohydrate ABC transporter permease [Treponema sp.]